MFLDSKEVRNIWKNAQKVEKACIFVLWIPYFDS